MELNIGHEPNSSNVRDAIHCAVISARVGEMIEPGAPVKFDGEGAIVAAVWHEKIGILDPFLAKSPKLGALAWLFMNPRSITSLRHHWTHPALPEDAIAANVTEKDKSVQWVERFAVAGGYTYDEVMNAAWRIFHDEYEYTYDNDEKYKEMKWEPFWPHWETITGESRPKSCWAPFTCSC